MKESGILNEDKIISELEDGGVISQRIEYYEYRKEQLDLMRLIIKSFNNDLICAAEAGTGVGKSFAYLLPAITFAHESEERIVISTASITLQEQLFYKDIPLVLEALGGDVQTEVKAVLVKGRNNFLCLRRLKDIENESDVLLKDEELENLREWAVHTKTGERSDMDFLCSPQVWGSVCSESDGCLAMRCQYFDSCFVMRVRRAAQKARIIVVNHHLLFADIAARAESDAYASTVVLPPYNRVIIDEAHTIENSATSFFSAEWSRRSLLRRLSRLYRKNGKLQKGLLLRLQAFYDGKDRSKKWNQMLDDIRKSIAALEDASLKLCGKTQVFRLILERDNIISEELFVPLANVEKTILTFTGEVSGVIEKARRGGENLQGGIKNEVDSLIADTQSVLNKVNACAELTKRFIEYKNYSDEVFWIERRTFTRQDYAVWTQAPVNIAQKLARALFEKFNTIVCLSATLTIADSFDYWARRSGAFDAKDEEGYVRKVLTGKFASPFPYSKCVLVASPVNAPLPGAGSDNKAFTEFVNDAVLNLILSAGGGALVLFTSFESLNYAFEYAAPELKSSGLLCMRQGDEDRSKLLKKFVKDKTSVLFATDSFWEGVDAPGETLKLLILCKLPFKPPGDPLFAARCEALEKQGINAFGALSVPEAVMKFRQGFGRLIRRSTDRGVVAVLDNRIIKKFYGQIFLRSLPPVKTCFEDLKTILYKTENFLN